MMKMLSWVISLLLSSNMIIDSVSVVPQKWCLSVALSCAEAAGTIVCTVGLLSHICNVWYKLDCIHIATALDMLKLPLEELSSMAAWCPWGIFLYISQPQWWDLWIRYDWWSCLVQGMQCWRDVTIMRVWINNCFLASFTWQSVDVLWYRSTTHL